MMCPDPSEDGLGLKYDPDNSLPYADYLTPENCRAVLQYFMLRTARNKQPLELYVSSDTPRYLRQLLEKASREGSGWNRNEIEQASSLLDRLLAVCTPLPANHSYCARMRKSFVARARNTEPINNDWDDPVFDSFNELYEEQKEYRVWVEVEDHIPPMNVRATSELYSLDRASDMDLVIWMDGYFSSYYETCNKDLVDDEEFRQQNANSLDTGAMINYCGVKHHLSGDVKVLVSVTDSEKGDTQRRRDIDLEEFLQRVSTKKIYRNDFS